MIRDIKVGHVIAWSSIKRGNKKTALFIIFVLALIFVNLVFLPSLIDGMMGLFVGAVKDYAYGDVVIEPSGDNSYIHNADSVVKKVRSVNGVRATSKRLEAGASLTYKQHVVGANVLGLLPDDEKHTSRYPHIVKEGEFLDDMSRDEIIIGAIIAGTGVGSEIYDKLDGVKVGSKVSVRYSNGVERTYKVRGIHEGTIELADLNAVVHYKELEDVLGLSGGEQATSIVVRTAVEGEQPLVKRKMVQAGVKEKIFTWQEKAEALVKQAVESMGMMNAMSEFVSLVVGAALIFIIIYINTLHRKREIGILMAIGISPRSIMISYMLISMFYISFGVLLGLLFFGSIISYLIANPITFYENLQIIPHVDYLLLLQSVVTMLVMSVIAGFIPALMVTRNSILDTIWGR